MRERVGKFSRQWPTDGGATLGKATARSRARPAWVRLRSDRQPLLADDVPRPSGIGANLLLAGARKDVHPVVTQAAGLPLGDAVISIACCRPSTELVEPPWM